MSDYQLTSQDILAVIRQLPAGTYTAWGIEFEGIYGPYLAPAPGPRARRALPRGVAVGAGHPGAAGVPHRRRIG